jgi:hypothetical protein
MQLTTKCFYNYFMNPFDDLKKQGYDKYRDIFYENDYGVQPNGPIAKAILIDFFGIDLEKTYIIDQQNKINILFGIYEGLIKIKSCNEYLLDNCLKSNRLDELITQKYKYYNNSIYYTNYIKNKISIGKTYEYIKDEKIFNTNFEIYDDDFCPSCNQDGFHTKKSSLMYKENLVPDCKKCCVSLCINCAYIDDKYEPWSKICFNCLDDKPTKNLNTNIMRKINSHKIYDKNRFEIEGNINLDYILELIKKQNNKCYICKENVLLVNWKPYCCYQFSIDRIKNDQPHNKNNVLISCYYCNCRHHSKFDQHYKVCNQKCHTEKKQLKHKNEINDEEIKLLML